LPVEYEKTNKNAGQQMLSGPALLLASSFIASSNANASTQSRDKRYRPAKN